jgi:YVTN family beta-propeller protein
MAASLLVAANALTPVTCLAKTGASMTKPQRACEAARIRRSVTVVRTAVTVALVMAARAQAPLAAQSDTAAPTVSITSPAAGERVGRNVNISATASDAGGVKTVTFKVDGVVVGTDAKPPYSVRWNSKDAAEGSHTLHAEARDGAGNVGTSAPVTVIVGSATATDKTAPTVSITSPAGGAQVTGTVALSAAASDDVGVTAVTFLVDGTAIGTDTSSPYGASWNSAAAAAGSHTLRAEARDAAGNVGTSATVTVAVVAPATDTTAPTVSITSPAGGAQVTGTVALAATASDAVGVTSVTFLVDAIAIGTDTTAPYSASWNSATVAAGSHTLRAEARDAAGNVGTSAAVTVTKMAANQPPSVTITAPVAGSSYQTPATVTIAANATDTDGSVARVDFYAGASMIGSDTTSPFSVTWTVSTAGTYSLSATAVDNAGATTASGAVSVAVTNPPVRPATAVFEPAADNDSVIRYVLDVFRDGSNPATSTPAATQDLGKPPVVNGEMTADIARTTALVPAATYVATVTAVTSTQSARSAASAPFVIAATSTLSASGIRAAGEAALAAESHGRLWVTNSATDLVAVFDATTGDALATIPVGLTPTGIAVSNTAGKVYVADEGSDTVSVISRSTMTLAHTIPLPLPSGRKPHSLSGSPDGRFIYVGELGSNVVDVIDTATDQISARFATGVPGSKTRVVVADPDGAILYAISRGAAPAPSTLVALDAETGRWLWQLPLDGDPSDFLVAADGRTGFVTRAGSSAIAVIDLERHALIKEIDPGHVDLAGTLQLSADGRHALITPSTLHAQVGIVDLATMTPATPMSLASSPAGSAMTARQLSYVCVAGSSELAPGVVAIDAGTRTVVRRFRFPGGGSPHTVVFDAD